jgi:LuxR family transcriptional regulator, maltose regulon positive regulatory protein
VTVHLGAPELDGPGARRLWVMTVLFMDAIARQARSDPAPAGRAPRGGNVGPPLTYGETRVLHYLPTNLSAREIADELCLSVNTVKTHQRHLYQKLGVCGRSQAVERARLLGLLAPLHRTRSHTRS